MSIPVPVQIGRRRFASITTAARAMGLHFSTARWRLYSDQFPQYTRLDPEPRPKHRKKGIAVIINGKQFESYQAAADYHDVNRVTPRAWCINPDYPDCYLINTETGKRVAAN